MTGRPTKRNDEIINRVIAGLSDGVPLAVLCREDGMPSDGTVRAWARDDSELSDAIACAREAGFDAIAHRVRATVRGKAEDDGGDSTGDVQRDRLIAETDLKLLAKWDPKRYGDKLDLSSSDGTMTPSREPSYKMVE